MLHAWRLALCLIWCFGIALTVPHAHGNESQETFLTASAEENPVSINLVAEPESIQPGKPFWLGLRLNIDKNWHAYWKNPGDAGMAPVVTWNLPEGFQVGPFLWPTPERFSLGSSVGFGYEGETILLAEITPPANFSEKMAPIGADVRWVVCSSDTCLPGESEASLQLPVSQKQPLADSHQKAFFQQARSLMPKPWTAIKVERKDRLIELTFNEHEDVQKAEFFPELSTAVDYSSEPLLQKQSSDQFALVLRENGNVNHVKGILALHTAKGVKSYSIDASISPSSEEHIIGMAENGLLKSDTQSPTIDSPQVFEGGVPLAIILAFVGGLILNLMPCVMPVMSFKILSFVKLAGESRRLIFRHGLAFSGGVLLSFWVLAALLLALQAYGRSVGWGFQLQEPLFVAVLAALLFTFALSLFGLFEMGTSLISVAGQAQQASGHSKLFSSFFSGVLATAVATPCTGPFLGSAVGFAVTLPAIQAMLIFTALGVGMSFPYLLLSAYPSLLRFVPKPGPWMLVFKELMGFLMLASVIWLVWVFGAQTNTFAISFLLAGFFLFAIAGWIYGRWATPLHKKLTRTISILIAAAFFGFGGYLLVMSTSSQVEKLGGSSSQAKIEANMTAGAWEEFSPERVAELRQKGIPVFIDFTAKWCLICQANHLVLTADEVEEKFNSLGVVRMKADWTKRDSIIADELKKLGRNSVPLYVLYGVDTKASPIILPQILTPEIVIGSLKQIETL